MTHKRIFITGGASGLGRALAERYARGGWRVAVGDVHEARLEDTARALGALGADPLALRCDVTSEADLEAAAAALLGAFGGVDVVVNNAGVAVGGGIEEVSLDDWRWILDVNLLGVVRGCKVFTPVLRRQGGGRFVNVASMAGLVHPPLMSAYSATKAAIIAVSETLRLELHDDGIEISVVCPSFFRTNLMDSLRAPNDEVAASSRKLVGEARHGADEIAERVFRGVERGDFHVLPHGGGKLAWMVKRLAPYSIYGGIVARASRRLGEPADGVSAASPSRRASARPRRG